MPNQFFHPYIGSRYQSGIRGKRVLVLGASFYCNDIHCPYFADCTNVTHKDSAKYDRICPPYLAAGKQLHNEPTYCVDDMPRTYLNFSQGLQDFLPTNDTAEVWDYLAFTNYVQFMLPAEPTNYRDTRPSDLSERDFLAFIETLEALQPDIVVIWGSVIHSCLKEQNPYLLDKQELFDTEGYVCHIQVPRVRHTIALINPYHPSSRQWYSGLDRFRHYFNQLL